MYEARPCGQDGKSELKSTNISNMARRNTGMVSGTEIRNRRIMSIYSGSGPSSNVISFGSSAIPQIGQLPGPIWTISGCIGQVYSIWDLGFGISDFESEPAGVCSCDFA